MSRDLEALSMYNTRRSGYRSLDINRFSREYRCFPICIPISE
jgi:hypothetical protein